MGLFLIVSVLADLRDYEVFFLMGYIPGSIEVESTTVVLVLLSLC